VRVGVWYLGEGTLLGQGALVHVLEQLLQSVPHCGMAPLLGWQILQLGAAAPGGRRGEQITCIKAYLLTICCASAQ
jgi:hypothetical protein